MEVIFKIIHTIITSINKIIDSFDKKTASAIKSGFIFLIFVFSIIAAFIGYQNGTEAARIKSPPLVPMTNDTFLLERSREKINGNFSTLIKENKLNEPAKEDIKKRNQIIMEETKIALDDGILEPENELKLKTTPELKIETKLFEEETERKTTEVSLLKNEKKKIRKLQPLENYKAEPGKSTNELKKIKINRLNNKKTNNPKIINNDKGIFNNWKLCTYS